MYISLSLSIYIYISSVTAFDNLLSPGGLYAFGLFLGTIYSVPPLVAGERGSACVRSNSMICICTYVYVYNVYIYIYTVCVVFTERGVVFGVVFGPVFGNRDSANAARKSFSVRRTLVRGFGEPPIYYYHDYDTYY